MISFFEGAKVVKLVEIFKGENMRDLSVTGNQDSGILSTDFTDFHRFYF